MFGFTKTGFQPLSAASLPIKADRSLIVHASEGWYQSVRNGHFDFFEKIADRARKMGITPYVVSADTEDSRALLGEDCKHILFGLSGPSGPNIYHAHPSYIWGFWYLDRAGVHWASSLAQLRFDPRFIDLRSAQYFFNGVAGHMLRENVSKLPQRDRSVTRPIPAFATIFLQDIEDNLEGVHFLTSARIIEETARFADEKIYVKFHPEQSQSSTAALSHVCSKYPHVEVSNESIHDLTSASGMVITQNSAAGFEALLQKKPLILCAKSDFHHAAITARSVQDLRQAFTQAHDHFLDFSYEKYLYWFLGLNMLEPQKEGFEDRVWETIFQG